MIGWAGVSAKGRMMDDFLNELDGFHQEQPAQMDPDEIGSLPDVAEFQEASEKMGGFEAPPMHQQHSLMLGQGGSFNLGIMADFDAVLTEPPSDGGNFFNESFDDNVQSAGHVDQGFYMTQAAAAPEPAAPLNSRVRQRASEETSDDDATAVGTPLPGTPTPSCSGESVQSSKSARAMNFKECCLFLAHTDRMTLSKRGDRERNWRELTSDFGTAYAWAAECGLSQTDTLKQKMKLFLQERRQRNHLKLWRTFQDKCSSVQDVANELKWAAGGQPSAAVGEQVPHFSWDFTVMAQYIFDRTRSENKREKGAPGSILDWPEGPRNDFVAKLVALHLDNGSTFFEPFNRFKDLVVLSEVEQAILSFCDCAHCKSWGLPGKVSSDCGKQLHEKAQWCYQRLAWTKTRCRIMVKLLNLHSKFVGRTEYQLYENVARTQDPDLALIAHWPDSDIKSLLGSSHSVKSCTHCKSGGAKRARMRGNKTSSSSAALCVCSLDDLEADAVETAKAFSKYELYDFVEEEEEDEPEKEEAAELAEKMSNLAV